MAVNNSPDSGLIRRHLQDVVEEALSDTPVVLIHGPRQAGKSTLARDMIGDAFPARYVSLDDLTVLAAARASPADFLAGFDGPVVIDEVQRAPDLFVTIKGAVDRDRRPGRFLLTGSADVQLVPSISESLAGRIEIVTLWPFSQGEIEGRRESFIDRAFAGEALEPVGEAIDRVELLDRALVGGYPEAIRRRQRSRREAWFRSYLTTILQREVRDLAEIEGLAEMPRLLTLIAARAGGLQNVSELSRASGLPHTTLKRYIALIEAAFLVRATPAWSGNVGKRLTRSPKLYPTDSGLHGHLLGLTPDALDASGASVGPLLETFVVAELRKQIGWSEARPSLYHYRSARQEEVDLVLEDARGRLLAIEIKASSRIEERDLRNLRSLKEAVGKRFLRGLVLYTGPELLAYGPDLHAVPVSALWRA